MKTMILPHVNVIGIYRSPRVPMQNLCQRLDLVLGLLCTSQLVYLLVTLMQIGWTTPAEGIYMSFLSLIIDTDN